MNSIDSSTMSQETVSVQVSSSWVAANQKSLKDAVTVTQLSAAKRDEDGTLTDMVELESCVLLSQPAEENGNEGVTAEPCSVTLRLDSRSAATIASVVVVCEARVIEVYGAYNEYLMTVPTDLLDEVDDMAVYSAEIGLNQVTQECTLRFARLSRSADMWIYGVKVIWNIDENKKKVCEQRSGLNFETVELRLNESQTQLSDRAANCKQFLKMYSSLNEQNKSVPGFSDPLALLSLLPGMGRRTQPLDKSLAQSVSQIFPQITPFENLIPVPKTENPGKDFESPCEKCKNFEEILERKLNSLESRIMNALDEKMSALQHHQDMQLQKLTSLLIGNAVSSGMRPSQYGNNSNAVSDQVEIEQAINKLKLSSYNNVTDKMLADAKEMMLKSNVSPMTFFEKLQETAMIQNNS